ncbi:hypothetical protein [Mesobacillus jeotgali]|uniref:hypothetical protein n=1 Tax=Mesobacillus jeotgali TaxID=129985 RepID=UPI0009A70BFA|nr:hypothetical protein [Mesobacillus jeotgali]
MKGMNIAKFFHFFLYGVFLLALLIVFYIIYADIDTLIAFRFVIGFVIFLILFGFFQIFLVIMNLRQLPSSIIRKRLLKFLASFAFFMALSWLANYFFKPHSVDRWDFGVPLGLALSLTLSDLMFIRNKQ